jgi:hypothetical protein
MYARTLEVLRRCWAWHCLHPGTSNAGRGTGRLRSWNISVNFRSYSFPGLTRRPKEDIPSADEFALLYYRKAAVSLATPIHVLRINSARASPQPFFGRELVVKHRGCIESPFVLLYPSSCLCWTLFLAKSNVYTMRTESPWHVCPLYWVKRAQSPDTRQGQYSNMRMKYRPRKSTSVFHKTVSRVSPPNIGTNIRSKESGI